MKKLLLSFVFLLSAMLYMACSNVDNLPANSEATATLDETITNNPLTQKIVEALETIERNPNNNYDGIGFILYDRTSGELEAVCPLAYGMACGMFHDGEALDEIAKLTEAAKTESRAPSGDNWTYLGKYSSKLGAAGAVGRILDNAPKECNTEFCVEQQGDMYIVWYRYVPIG